MELVIAPTREEQDALDFNPLPTVALGNLGGRVSDWKLAMPADGGFLVTFEATGEFWTDSVYVRYTELIPPTRLFFKRAFRVLDGDTMTVTIRSHR